MTGIFLKNPFAPSFATVLEPAFATSSTAPVIIFLPVTDCINLVILSAKNPGSRESSPTDSSYTP